MIPHCLVGFCLVCIVSGGFAQDSLNMRRIGLANDPVPSFLPNALSVHSGLACVSTRGGGFATFDIHNPIAPTLAGFHDSLGAGRSVVTDGNFAYYADSEQGVHVFNVSDVSNPVLLTTFCTSGTVWDVALQAQYLYVAHANNGVSIFDVSSPQAPVEVGNIQFVLNVRGVAVLGDFVFAANEEYGLKLIDVSNPQSPTLIDSIDTPGWANRVAASGHLAFVADNFSGIRVIDFSNPQDLVEVGHLESPHGMTRVAIARENACAVIISNRIQIHDFSVPSSPLELGYYPSGGNDIVVRDGLAYVLSDSLSIFDISAALTTPEHHNEIPTQFSLHPIYPNPFNNTANISFDLPREVTGRLVVYDMLGRVTNTLHDGKLSAGTHSMQFNGANLSSGTYFVKLESPVFNSVQKAVLVK